MNWHLEARRLRAEGWALKAIGQKLGKSTVQVGKACRDIECPVNHMVLSQRRRRNKGRRVIAMFDYESPEDLPNG
jgi:hypothetical protein